MSQIEHILGLERIDRDIFRGPAADSKLPRTFGGQVAAQALVAATETIERDLTVHSLHGYFVAPGKSADPTIFLVDRIRDGGSFASRQVRAVQDGETIFSMQASFHRRDDAGPEHSAIMRDVPGPEELTQDGSTLPVSSRALLEEWGDWDIHVVPSTDYERDKYSPGQQVVWFRSRRPLPDDETFHICTLAYMSDMTLLHSAMVPHPDHRAQMASLDHAMWFLRPFRADEWLLYDQVSPSAHGGRALTHGRIFDRAGNLVAVVTQEGLTRTLREGGEVIPTRRTASK
ncbi:acyl-CoA thioesterase II [Corynebacterium sp. YIM 101645]|uniref:Acyl-CoA thioesterase II n=1 Tax=Corynebacterium lemuris TaxID=1859292 RepID=A0ABT2FV16_9CORY|nr:acyl-CoA thioesterase II [Corynebacterium lemuris]MCS5479083.1 acyl-CoA thioesterase II [Corynebacterium lemuris]